jgi:hypothetical protein
MVCLALPLDVISYNAFRQEPPPLARQTLWAQLQLCICVSYHRGETSSISQEPFATSFCTENRHYLDLQESVVVVAVVKLRYKTRLPVGAPPHTLHEHVSNNIHCNTNK